VRVDVGAKAIVVGGTEAADDGRAERVFSAACHLDLDL